MKIENSTKPVGLPRPAASRAPVATSAAPTTAGTQVQISSASAQLKGSDGVVDANRVAEIKQAIAEGRFQINPERIADGLLESVRQMLGGTSER
ncbi:MAG: flagellar biosynthesis anti-sigma factor FlgM [Rhodocyclaceae bacterium]|nr:flagellar biosynthesis anti-sigma factor FlgM [Rhodocyclaceae bacterium]